MTEDHTDEKTDVASARVVVVGGGVPPRPPRNNRRIAPPIMRASFRSFFARLRAFLGLMALAVLRPVSVACRGILGMRQALHSVTGTLFLLLSRNEFNA